MEAMIRSRRRLAGRGARALLAVGLGALVLVGVALATSSRATVAPSNNSLPSISGSASVGSTLTANSGTWNGSTPFTYQYQWMRCDTNGASCAAISGATGSAYQLQSSDQGTTVRVEVIASNSDGSANATSGQTAAVTAATGPTNTVLPTVSGTTTVGNALSATSGSWSGSTISYAYQWQSCDATGANCKPIAGATAATYQLASSDAGTTLRAAVTATDPAGSASATSAQTATIAASATTKPPSSSGCPTAPKGQGVPVTSVEPPARLQIKTASDGGGALSGQTQSFPLTFTVTDTCGQPVSGAQVYTAAVPYGQFAIPAQATTDPTGSVTVIFKREKGFPAAKNQQLLVLFVRASRAGDPLLAGISTRRLVAIKVSL